MQVQRARCIDRITSFSRPAHPTESLLPLHQTPVSSSGRKRFPENRQKTLEKLLQYQTARLTGFTTIPKLWRSPARRRRASFNASRAQKESCCPPLSKTL